MSEIGELKRMMSDHMDVSSERHLAVMLAIKELQTKEKVNHGRIKELETDNKNTEAVKNKGRGMAILATVIWAICTCGISLLVGLYIKTH